MGRPKYLTWLHSLGFILAIAALVIGGLRNPAIGFPIAMHLLADSVPKIVRLNFLQFTLSQMLIWLMFAVVI